MHKGLIIGLNGTELIKEERRWLKEKPPLGVILFARNIENLEQVRALLDGVRDCTGEVTWAAIDEEGGRVNRIPWAPFSDRRSAAEYGQLWLEDQEKAEHAAYQDNLRVGQALAKLGFTHNCAPVLDIFHPEGHGIIGERAYADDPGIIARLGSACMRGLSDAGIEAVGKHFPGHGRANADSHVAMPEVDAPLDTLLAEAQTFSQLIAAGIKHIMTAHVVYKQVEPQVATLSPFWLKHILRQQFGFTGRIWSDDLCMKGVGDEIQDAARKAHDAGCDVLLACEPQGVEKLLGTQ
ncbi:MAG: beta-N-acetylhexosaminidase [Zetaproteobacteria bacterium]|nr:MAG: beta-N-acetylhexosaminidase [Zetaproteobacteria bacterium]